MNKIDDLKIKMQNWWRAKKNATKERIKSPEKENNLDFERKEIDFLYEYLVNKKKISPFYVLVGQRRIGKTVILLQLLKKLVEKEKIPESQIFYYSLDQLLSDNIKPAEFQFFIKEKIKTKKIIYLFLDEVQSLEKWDQFLKVLYDEFCFNSNTQIKIIATGSSCLKIQTETGIDRFILRKIWPWTYEEYFSYLSLCQKKSMIKNQNLFFDYLSFGQFPKLFSMTLKEEKIKYLRNYVFQNAIKDLIKTQKMRIGESIVWDILFYLLHTTNNEVVEKKICSLFKLETRTLQKILNGLVDVQIISKIQLIKGNLELKRLRKYKYYFFSPNFVCALLGFDFKSVLSNLELSKYIGSITESYTLQQLLQNSSLSWNKTYYVKNEKQQEIDFLLIYSLDNKNMKRWKVLLEVKYRDIVENQINNFFLNFPESRAKKVILVKGKPLPSEQKLFKAKNISFLLLEDFDIKKII